MECGGEILGRNGVILNNAALGGGGNILNGNDKLRNESLLGTAARILAKSNKNGGQTGFLGRFLNNREKNAQRL